MTEQSDKSAMDEIRALINPKDIKRAMEYLSEGVPDGVTNDEFFKVRDAALVIHDDVLFQEAAQHLKDGGPAYAALKALKEISDPGRFEGFKEMRAQAQRSYDTDLYAEAQYLSGRNAPARARWCLDEIENKAAFPDYDVLSTEINKACGRHHHKSALIKPEP